MLKKVFNRLSTFVFLLFFIFTSCTNLAQQKSATVSFNIGKAVSEQISKNNNNSIKDDSNFRIECNFIDLNIASYYVTTTKKDLKNASITLSNLPFNKPFKILIKVYFNSVVIYQGESEAIELTEDNNGHSISISLTEKRGKITLDYKGYGKQSLDFPKDYYIDSPDIVLPIPEITEPESKMIKFEGWFTSENFEPETKVTTLGQNNYLGTVTLHAYWKDILPPGEIYKPQYEDKYAVDIIPGDRKVTLYWENPKDEDFDHVIIYKQNSGGELIKLEEVSGIPNQLSYCEVKNLTNGEENSFVLKTVDKAGNISEGTNPPIKATSYDLVPESAKHNTVTILRDDLSNGTYGNNGTYVLFGDYPQTVMQSGVSIDESKIYLFNDMPCYLGSDGSYYVKYKPTPTYSGGTKNVYKNGVTINSSSDSYFKIEPLKWRVLDKKYVDKSGSNKGVLLFAEDILINSRFASDSYDYDKSDIKGFLNNRVLNKREMIENHEDPVAEPVYEIHKDFYKSKGFAQWAFSENILNNIIQDVQVTNSSEKDKVFILSIKELSKNYGFPGEDLTYQGIKVPARQRTPSDYARAKGAFISNDSDETDWWWTRDKGKPGEYDSETIKAVGFDGNLNSNISNYERDGGIVPAIVIASNAIEDFSFKPGNLVNFDGYYESATEKIIIRWEDSSYNNYSTIKIKYNLESGEQTKDLVKGQNLLEIENIQNNGKNYSFKATTYDSAGNYSDSVSCSVVANEKGYVVLKDGSVKHYKALQENEKTDVIAVVFGKSGQKYLGMAVQEKTGDGGQEWGGGFCWAKENTPGDSTSFDSLKCDISTDLKSVTGGYTSGVDSWAKICEKDNTAADNPGNYPAFEYANNYGSSLPADAAESVKAGWYVPAMKEIIDIYNNKALINNILNYIGGTPITDWYWWSCNQHGSTDRALQFSHEGGAPGKVSDDVKHKYNTVRCVKQF